MTPPKKKPAKKRRTAPKRPACRPSRWNAEAIKAVIAAITDGCPRRVAAALVGFSERELYRRIEKDGQFRQAVEKADAAAVHKMVKIVEAAAPNSWQAAWWGLERRHPRDWARRDPATLPPDPPPGDKPGDKPKSLAPDATTLTDAELEAAIMARSRKGGTEG